MPRLSAMALHNKLNGLDSVLDGIRVGEDGKLQCINQELDVTLLLILELIELYTALVNSFASETKTRSSDLPSQCADDETELIIQLKSLT